MPRSKTTRKLISAQSFSLLIVAVLLVAGLTHLSHTAGDQLPDRSLTLTKALASVTDTYKLTFTIPNAETLGSIDLQFCANSPIIGLPCDLPTGFSAMGASLTTQTGVTDFTILSATANEIILTRTASSVVPGPVSYEFTGIANPSAAGSYYGRLATYASTDASGPDTDHGGIAFAINSSLAVSATVPPYLYFCVGITIQGIDCTTATGNYINFGEFSPKVASAAQSQMVAGTNADTGYNIVMGGQTLTSGNNVIPALATDDVSRPGTSQFGMNLTANQDPQIGSSPSGDGVGQPTTNYNQPNRYKFADNDTLVTVPVPDAPREYTVSYVANISNTQPAGIYVSTLTYVATAKF